MAKKRLLKVISMTKINKVPYIKQTVVGGLYDFTNKKFTKTHIPNSVIKNGYKIRTSGCGLCCTAMAIYYCTGKYVEPNSLSAKYIPGHGSSHDIGYYEATKRGIPCEYTNDINKVVDALNAGYCVMSIQGKGLFTKHGHYILLIGVTESGKIAVNDPASSARTYRISGRSYTKSQIDKTCKKSDGRGYTIFKMKPAAAVKKTTAKKTTVKKNANVLAYQKAWNKNYAKKVKIQEDGLLGSETKATFKKVSIKVQDNKHRDMVKLVQKLVGMGAKSIDGKYGNNTEKAVKAYQKKNGLSVDGVVGAKTLEKLIK